MSYNLAAWMEMAGVPSMVMPFENRIESVIKKFIEIYSNDSIYSYDRTEKKYVLPKDEKWLNEWVNILNDKQLYFLNKRNNSNRGFFSIDFIQSIIEYAVKFFDIRFFAIDHLHYFLKISDARHPNLVIEESMRTIKQWTDDYNCHIVLNVHPHMTQDSRTGKTARLGLNSSKGSSAIPQECDNFWVIERAEKQKDGPKFNRARLRVEKNREVGKTGDIYFRVLPNRNSYVAITDETGTEQDAKDRSSACKDSEW